MARSQGRQLFLFWTLVCKEHQHNMINTTPPRQHHQHNAINTSSSTQHHQHNTNISLILRGRCSTRSNSREVHGSPATIEYCGRRLRLPGRRSTWSTSVSFCVAGATLGAPQSHFAWQVQHAEHLQRGPRKSGDD